MRQFNTELPNGTVGMDVSDRYTWLYGVDANGRPTVEERIRTTPDAVRGWFAGRPPLRVVLEVGTHSPWVSRVVGPAATSAIDTLAFSW